MTNTHLTPSEPDRNPFFGQGGDEPLTMSSREIAELVEKQHKHVMRDIKSMLDQINLNDRGYAQTWTHPQNGQQYEEYLLPEDLVLTLMTGYRADLRYRVVKDLERLRREQRDGGFQLPNFADPGEAARAWAEQFERSKALQLESAAKDSEIATMRPKVDEYEAYLATEGVVKIMDFCNKYGVKKNHPGYVLRERAMLHQKKTIATQVGIKAGVLRNVVSRDGFEYVDSKGQAVEAQTAMVAKDREAVLLRMIIDGYGQTAFRNPVAFQRAKMILSDGGEA